MKEKPDKVIHIVEWMEIFKATHGVVDAGVTSDHNPIVLFLEKNKRKVRKDIKFESKWLVDDECKNLVFSAWQTSKEGCRMFCL
ncbi:hypothetical protein REPUB_Repub15cG0010600 [Reevesia pubescens]